MAKERTIPNTLRRDIVVIGGSAGSMAVLRQVLAKLPADYPAAVFIVVHTAPETPSVLADLLDRVCPLQVVFAKTGDAIRPGKVFVAPPDFHLMLEAEDVRLSHGARENAHRPSIDVLFRSAAVAFGARVVGVVLSGMLDDGAAGLWAVKRRGGVAIVQHPRDAEFPDMPSHAIAVTEIDHEVPARDLAAMLVEVTGQPVPGRPAEVPEKMMSEVRMVAENDSRMADVEALGTQVPLTCPECGGALWELSEGGPRYRCHVGHAYSLNTLAKEQVAKVEAALWAALRSLEQSQRLARRMASEARGRGNERSAHYQEEIVRTQAGHADTLRALLADATAPSEERGAAA